MAREFTPPIGRSKTGLLAVKDLFNNSLTVNKDRTFTYKRWSEKATVIKYNAELETYDIVVTTISYSGKSASVNKVNRTIRNVKSIIPATVHIFEPGETVLIGYISERRESPVILGLRAAKSNRNITVIDTDSPDSCPFNIRRLDTDEDITNEDQIQVTCSHHGPQGLFKICLEVLCEGANSAWHWNSPDCSKDGVPLFTVTETGINSKIVCFGKTGATTSFGSTHPCYAVVSCFRSQDNAIGGGCNRQLIYHFFNSVGATINTLGSSCSSSFGGDCEACAAISCSTCNDPTSVPGTISGCPKPCYFEMASCEDNNDIPIHDTGSGDFLLESYNTGYAGWQLTGGEMDSVLTAEQQATNLTEGCCGCATADGTIITYSDDDQEWSTELKIDALEFVRVL